MFFKARRSGRGIDDSLSADFVDHPIINNMGPIDIIVAAQSSTANGIRFDSRV